MCVRHGVFQSLCAERQFCRVTPWEVRRRSQSLVSLLCFYLILNFLWLHTTYRSGGCRPKWVSLYSFLEVVGRICLPALPWLPEAACIPWLMAPFFSNNHPRPVKSSPHGLTLMPTLCPCSMRTLVIHWAHQDNPEYFYFLTQGLTI